MITQQHLHKVLDYSPISGLFIWNEYRNHLAIKGDRAGSIQISSSNGKKYRSIMLNNRNYPEHRLAWFYIYGVWPVELDHINQNGTDNKLDNLREVPHQTNMKNLKLNKKNTSGISGVYWFKPQSKWKARIIVNRREHHLGYFSSFFDACCARKSAEVEHKFHTNHGRNTI